MADTNIVDKTLTCNFETQTQLGATGNIKFCGDYAYKIFHGKQDLTNIINDKTLNVDSNSPNSLRSAKREWNEILILNWLKNFNADIIVPHTNIYYLYGDEPENLETMLLTYFREQLGSGRNARDILLGPETHGHIKPIDEIINGSFPVTLNNYIIFIVSEKLEGTVRSTFANYEADSAKTKDLLIYIMYLLNNLNTGFDIVHNDTKNANILYKKLPTVIERTLNFIQPDGTNKPIIVRLDVEVYLTDFEWSYCNYPLYGYQVVVPEYLSDHENDPVRRPIVPRISIDLPQELRDQSDTYKYGTYYRGFDVIARTSAFQHINQLSTVYPRLFTIDVLMFVTECLKYGIPKDKSVQVILNFYMANYVRIATNDTEPRYRGKVDYKKASGYVFAVDIRSFGDRVGI